MGAKSRPEESFGIIPLRFHGGKWEVLLLRHHHGHWSFPKGHAEAGERAKDSAIRELQEESGLSIKKFIKCSFFQERYTHRGYGEERLKTVTYFPALVEGTLKVQEEEVSDSRWVSLQESLELLTFPEIKGLMERFIREVSLPNEC